MAAPTSVRVESKNYRTANLAWAYSGASSVGVYRALFGGSFSLIATVSAATLAYTDTTVADATRYSYKLSDDVGLSFSSTVSVVVQTAELVKADPEGPHASPVLPRAFGESLGDLEAPVNEAFEQIENAFAAVPSLMNSLDVERCQVCSSNGAIIVDCRNGCTRYQVAMSESVNSITLIGCGECPDIDFQIPSGSSYSVCGWPAICGYEGDECEDTVTGPITVNSKGNTTDPEFRPMTCDCAVQTTGERIKYSNNRNTDNLSLKHCVNNAFYTGFGNLGDLILTTAGVDENLTSTNLKACGGMPPYTWTITGNCSTCNDVPQGTCTAYFTPTVTGAQDELLKISVKNNTCEFCSASYFGQNCVLVVKDFLLTTISVSLLCSHNECT